MDVYFDYHHDAYNIKGLSKSRLNQEMPGCYYYGVVLIVLKLA